MVLEQEKKAIKAAMQELSTQYGNSLLFKKEKAHMGNEAVVLIGLGGMGGKTLNQIKKRVRIRFENTDMLSFLAIDTCIDDLVNITYPDGNLTADETVQLFDSNSVVDFRNPDEGMKTWMQTDKFSSIVLNGSGAQGTRQLGRAMLYHQSNYERVHERIEELINNAKTKADSIKVILISGVSGGTGSGTIIDIGYMIRDIIDRVLMDRGSITTLGYIYTPDVQEEDAGITRDDSSSFFRNGYAALKEIDYFYNIEEYNGEYQYLHSGYGENGLSFKNIFNHCTLISRYSDAATAVVCMSSHEAISIVADSITILLSDISLRDEHNNPVITDDGVNSNEYTKIEQFYHSKQANLNLPEWGAYKYRALAYGSLYVPRDELIAYCSNILFEKLKEQWNNLYTINKSEIDAQMEMLYLDDLDRLINELFYRVVKPIRLSPEDDDYPKIPFPAGFGKVKGIENAFSYFNEKAKIRNLDQKMENEVDRFVEPILRQVELAFQDTKKGPFFAINFLSSGINDCVESKVDGVMVRLRNLLGEINATRLSYEDQVNQSKIKIQQIGDSLSARKLHTREEIESYVSACEKYANVLCKLTICDNIDSFLGKVEEKINEKNRRLYDIYTLLINELAELLKYDAEYTADIERKRLDTGEIFTFDVTNMNDDDPKSRRFKTFFKRMVDTVDIERESQNFIREIFLELKKQEARSDNSVNQEVIVNCIQSYFKGFFNQFCTDTIQKLCVIAYGDSEMTPEQLTALWANQTDRDHILNQVGRTLAEQLQRKSRILLKASGSANFDSFTGYYANCYLAETDDLNRIMRGILKGNHGIINNNWSEFISYKIVYGIPLFLVDGLNEWHSRYNRSLDSAIGLHLNEVNGSWKELPEPYSYSAAQNLKEATLPATEKDKAILDDIRADLKKAIEYGIVRDSRDLQEMGLTRDYKNGIISGNEEHYFLINKIVAIPENLDQLKNGFINAIENGTNADLVKLMKGQGFNFGEPVALTWRFDPRISFIEKQRDLGEGDNYGNLIRIVRSSLSLRRELKKGIALFENYMSIYEYAVKEIENENAYVDAINSFVLALKYNVIYLDSQTRRWKYLKGTNRDGELVNLQGSDPLDREMGLYQAFYHYFKLESENRQEIDNYVIGLNESDVIQPVSRPDIAENAQNVLTNDAYLDHDIKSEMVKIFKSAVLQSKFSYDLPRSIENIRSEEGVKTVIDNLEDFYNKIKYKQLETV